MKRVTHKDAYGHYYMTGDGIFLTRSTQDRFMGEDIDAVGHIEDILGDDYDLDRLHALVEADREGRCVVLLSNDDVYTIRGDIVNGIIKANCRDACRPPRIR